MFGVCLLPLGSVRCGRQTATFSRYILGSVEGVLRKPSIFLLRLEILAIQSRLRTKQARSPVQRETSTHKGFPRWSRLQRFIRTRTILGCLVYRTPHFDHRWSMSSYFYKDSSGHGPSMVPLVARWLLVLQQTLSLKVMFRSWLQLSNGYLN